MFFRMVLSGVLIMTLYVGWRTGTVPWVRRHSRWWARWSALLLLGASYVLARQAARRGWVAPAHVLEILAAHWIGTLLLLFVAMLGADLGTAFGLLFRRRAPSIRGWALVAGFALAAAALVQGHRAPVVRNHEVTLQGMPASADGTSLVFVSDMHLGSLVSAEWLRARIAEIAALRPDAIIVGGDILEGDSASEREYLPLLGRLTAPLGVWAVAGNHEYHLGGVATLAALESQGFRVLRNEWRELKPGLFLAGVDGGRMRRDGERGAAADDRLARTLAGLPAGAATILVSHQPARVEDAARAGVGLMLSGHTHDGQIWPFRYAVRTQTRYLAGPYDVAGMRLIVCRGTGTFGPRMRLWYPSEMLRITLRCR